MNKYELIDKIKADLKWVIKYPTYDLGVKTQSFKEVIIDDVEIQNSNKELFKLGYYYEFLIEVLLKASGLQILHKSLQVIEGGITKGELDFVYKNKLDEVVHLEVACKFYMEYVDDLGEVKYLGPDARDSLSKKLEKLKSHQLQIETPLPVDYRASHLQVVMFKKSPEVNEVNSWSYISSLELEDIEGWFFLPKLSWLSGFGGEPVKSWEEEKKKILHSQRASQYAKFENGELVNRLILVSQSWPLKT